MSITLQNISDQVGDYLGNYTTSMADPGAKFRAINRSIEFLKRRLGLPSDETIQTIDFTEDQFFYDLNDDFDEQLQLLYHNPMLNTPDKEWEWFPYSELLQRTGDSSALFKWSLTTINGKNQLVMVGQNLSRSVLIESFDNIGDWVASGDASALTRDALQKYNGDASLSFTATRSSGTATLKKSTYALDVQDWFEKHAILKLWNRIPNTNITNVILRLYNDNSNYWTITETALDDGTVFAANDWKKLGFPLDDAVQSGSPDITSNVTKIEIDFTLAVGFTTGTIRVDDLFAGIPDSMDLIYITRNKGTDTTGVTAKNLLTVGSDILRIGEYFDNYLDLIAKKAALILMPQLKGDLDYWSALKNEFKDDLRDASRAFPRKRLQGTSRHSLRR